MHKITRRLSFDAGHRLLDHEGACKYLHGHRYEVDITVTGGLDEIGRVVDFKVVKELVGGWINQQLDHNMILNVRDPLVELLNSYMEGLHPIFAGRCPFIMSCNPTAENIASKIYKAAVDLLPRPLTVLQVCVWETPNCCADFTP